MSISKFGFFTTAFFLFGAVWLSSSGYLVHDDVFWHLKTGQVIAQKKAIPREDSYSFTQTRKKWITHEWGFALSVYFSYWIHQEQGMIALKQIVTLLLFLFLLLACLQQSETIHWFGWMSVFFLFLLSIQKLIILRAALFSALFFVILLLLLNHFKKTKSKASWGGILLLFCVWSNVHSGVVFGFFALFCFLLESIANTYVQIKKKREVLSFVQTQNTRSWSLLLFLCVLLSFLNPNGIDLFLYPLYLNQFFFHSGIQFNMGIFQATSFESHPFFFVTMAFYALSLLPFSQLKKLSVAEVLLTFFFAVLAFRSNRFVFYFQIVAVLQIIRLNNDRFPFSRRFPPLFVVTSDFVQKKVWLFFGGFLLLWFCFAKPLQPSNLWDPKFPVKASAFLKKHNIQSRLFNHQNWGGFLIWYANQKVFWDGRNLLFAPINKAFQRMKSFEEVVQKYRLEGFLVTKSDYYKLYKHLSQTKQWGLVYFDSKSVLFLQRSPKHKAFLAQHEYNVFRPFGEMMSLSVVLKNPQFLELLKEEILRALQDNPRNPYALNMQGIVQFKQGNYTQALPSFQVSFSILPSRLNASYLATLYQRLGQKEQALLYRKKALQLR